MSARRPVKPALLLVVVGVACGVRVAAISWSGRAPVEGVPIDLAHVGTREVTFTTPGAFTYEVAVATRRVGAVPFEDHCALLFGRQPLLDPEHPLIADAVQLSAELFAGGEPVEIRRFGPGGGTFRSDRIDRGLALFEGRPGASYRLVVHVERPTPKLAATRPELMVSLSPAAAFMHVGTPIVGWTLLGLVVGGLGLVLLVASKLAAFRTPSLAAPGERTNGG